MGVILAIFSFLLGSGGHAAPVRASVAVHPPLPVVLIMAKPKAAVVAVSTPAAPQFVRTENEARCSAAKVVMLTEPGATGTFPSCQDFTVNPSTLVMACITYHDGGTWETVQMAVTGPECSDQYGQGFSGGVNPDALIGAA